MKVSKPETPVTLKANINAFISSGKVNKQTVHILINGQKAGEWVITKRGFHEETLIIPVTLFRDNKTVITFNILDAVSPAEVGVGLDVRVLGIAVNSLVLFE